MVLLAVHAHLDGGRRGAHPAGLEVREPVDQLALELLVTLDRLASFLELAPEERPQIVHRRRTQVGAPPSLDEVADLLQREPEPMQQVDPPHALDRTLMVEAEAPARA